MNCARGASASTWQRRGGGIPAPCSLVVDKGEVGGLLDKAWWGGEPTGVDHKVAALPGLCHAEIGIVQGMPGSAWVRLSTQKATK